MGVWVWYCPVGVVEIVVERVWVHGYVIWSIVELNRGAGSSRTVTVAIDNEIITIKHISQYEITNRN